jgi:hypothetical protein
MLKSLDSRSRLELDLEIAPIKAIKRASIPSNSRRLIKQSPPIISLLKELIIFRGILKDITLSLF